MANLSQSLRALVLRESGKAVRASIEELSHADFPMSGGVLIRISHSSVNYKDALAVTGEGKIVRAAYPFIPGIDLVGEIVESGSSRFNTGDCVIGTGGGLGETSWGGYATEQRISEDWLVPLPDGLSPWCSMAVGTAGLTAMLSLMKLEKLGLSADSGPVVVTGASGGVGSLSVLLLARSGYDVVASTGKTEARSFLVSLGASEVIDRSDLAAGAGHALESATWAGAIDTVGGSTLEALISKTSRHGSIAVCGLAGGAALNTTVYPFILRGVNLLGIDSNTCPVADRVDAWQRLTSLLDDASLDHIAATIRLEDIPLKSHDLLRGRIIGRTVVVVSGSHD